MRPTISGQHFKIFLQDPHYWGQGQAYENLELVVNGVAIGAPEFDQDWDPIDLKDDDEIIIVGGRLVVEDQQVPRFIAQMTEEWLIGRGLKEGSPSLIKNASIKKPFEKGIIQTQKVVKRPTFQF